MSFKATTIVLPAAIVIAAFACGPAAAATVWAVGDGAYAGPNDDAVTNLVAAGPADQLLYLGDVYEAGTASEYATNYDSSYGRLKPITRPTPGNHEWGNRATGYDPYWGPSYSDPHYYAFDLAGWHLVSLNSEEPMGEGSAQLDWLRADLAGRSDNCTIAFWHKPRFSAGAHGDHTATEPLWRALAGRARIVLAGHDHNYQRFVPVDGITSFVVGTGGKTPYPYPSDLRLAAGQHTAFGALALTLRPGLADFAFRTTGGSTFDAGTIPCDQAEAGADPAPPVAEPSISLKRKFLRLRHRSKRLRVRFALSQDSTVELRIQRRSRGRYGKAKTLTRKLAAGSNAVAISRRMVRPGLFRITLVATDANRARSQPVVIKLRVAR
jgi:hypothetical protein